MTERDKQIIDSYLNDTELTVNEIAKKFGVSNSTVTRIARINNLPRRGGKKKQIPPEIEQEIKEKYRAGISKVVLGKEYKYSYEIINRILEQEEKVSIAKRGNPNLIENYFEKIDSLEKAYWLGWVVSDGTITYEANGRKRYDLSLTIKKEDEDILLMLEKDLGVSNKISPFQEKYSRFYFSCKKIVLDLMNLGITQNKTFTVKVPKFDKKFNAAFLRGLFDGDGGFTVYTRKTGQHCQELSFCGNEYVIQWVADVLFEEIPNLTKNSITKESSIKRIRWSSKKDITLIRDYLYKNHNNHYLKRKYDLIYANTEVSNQITEG